MKHRDYVDEREERCAVCDDGDTDYVCDQCAELPPDYDGLHRPQEQKQH